MNISEKIKTFEDLIYIIAELKKTEKKIVQVHGIFDVIHPGIIRHIQSAKSQGDILVITVIKDKDVTKGPGYPIFNEKLRAENIASIGYVDYVSLVDDNVPFECIKLLKADIFAVGNDYKEKEQEAIKKLKYEEEAIRLAGCKIHYTPGLSFSSTNIIKQFLEIYPEETKEYLNEIKKKYSAAKIIDLLESLKDLKVLVMGDTIIDEYCYCAPMAKSLKDNLVVNRYMSEERFAGGVLAVANHIAGLCDNVHLVTTLGKNDSKEEFIAGHLKANIKPTFFYLDNSPTIIKRRFIDQYLNKKLFELAYIDDNELVCKNQEKELLEYILNIIAGYDFVLVSDFGHGFMTDNLIKAIEEHAKISVVNVQTNGANMGYNMITKYHKINFACIDEPEARLATQNRWGHIEDIAAKIVAHINTDCLVITRGKAGSMALASDGNLILTPALASNVVDRLGCGDAFLSFVAPCFARRFPLDLISFIGNTVGALAVQIVGNKEPVEPGKLYEFIYTLLR